MKKSEKIPAWRAVVGLSAAIAVMVAAQLAAMFLGGGSNALGFTTAVGNAVSAVLYPLFGLIGLKIVCNKLLGVTLSECRITVYKIKPVWAAAAFIMPALAVGGLLMTAGHWNNTQPDSVQLADIVTRSVLIAGLAVGTVEEAVFRGVVMKAIEMCRNKAAAVLVPSLTFGAIHIFNGKLSVISFIQLLTAGSIVGILFSFVTYESGSIWSGALMHSVWNMCMASGLLNIGTEPSEDSLFNYVLETSSPLITGGEFGVEASVISIGAYLIFTALAAALIIKKRRFTESNETVNSLPKAPK